MAITAFPQFVIPNHPSGINNTAGAPTFSQVTLNAINDKCAFIVRVPKTGTLHSFEWRTGSVTNNPDNGVRMSFQDIDGTTGFPDGVQDQFYDITGTLAATTWQVPATPMTNTGLSGGTKRSVTQGDLIACVIEFVNFVASDTFQISCHTQNTADVFDTGSGWVANASTGAYAKDSLAANIALKYDDGSYGTFPTFTCMPVTTIQSRVFNNGSTPDERAMRFKVPITCRVKGVVLRIAAGTSSDFDIVLYDNTSTPLTTISVDATTLETSNGQAASFVFPASQTISANTVYRVALKPTTANNLTWYEFDTNSNAILESYPGGIEWWLSTRTDGGSWNDASTATRPFISLIIDGFDVGTGGAGGSFTFVG